MEDFLRACRDTIKDNDAKVLASKMALSHVSLLQRANPDNDDHHLTIEHLYGVMLHTGSLYPLEALANEFSCDVVRRVRPEPKPLLVALAAVSAECGDAARFVVDALADNYISQHEKAQGDRTIVEAIEALQRMRESLKAA